MSSRGQAVGQSSGGLVATALAEQRPGLVSALALIDTGPSPDAKIPDPAATAALLLEFAAASRAAPGGAETADIHGPMTEAADPARR